jgi:S1-C subfamily serine protease
MAMAYKASAVEEVTEAGPTLADLDRDLAELASRARRSLVRVVDGGRGAGAGVVLHEQGLIVTNAHVVRGRRVIVEDAGGRQMRARTLGVDPRHDLAALSVESEDLSPLEFGDSQGVMPGSWVMALGHPFGVLGGTSAGVAIGVGSDLPGAPPGREWLALSLQLRPGHSGGPVVDDGGRLLGLNTMMAGLAVGLAVPAHVVKRFLKEAMSSRPAPRRRRGRRGETFGHSLL